MDRRQLKRKHLKRKEYKAEKNNGKTQLKKLEEILKTTEDNL